MVGITSYGAYIPLYRMDRRVVLNQIGWFARVNAKGEKAVANHDEDSNTMAHAAVNNCLLNAERDAVGGLLMSSLSFPFANRQNAGVVASALNLRDDVRTADFRGSLSARSLLYWAVWAQDNDGEREAALAASAGKAYCSEVYRSVAAGAIQVLGAIGVSWDHDIHFYLRRAKANEMALGDPVYHRERIVQLLTG